jgi:hypothetical protein
MKRQFFWRKRFEDEDPSWYCISVHFLLSFFRSFFLDLSFLTTTTCRCGRLFLHLMTLSNTHARTYTFGRTPLDEGSARRRDLYLYITQNSQETDIHRTPLYKGSARRRDLYLITHNTHNRQTSIGLLWTRDQPVAETST